MLAQRLIFSRLSDAMTDGHCIDGSSFKREIKRTPYAMPRRPITCPQDCLPPPKPRRSNSLVGGPRRRCSCPARVRSREFFWPTVPTLQGEVEGIFLADRADVALTYCSGAPAVTREVPGLETVPLPLELTVGPALWHGPAQRPSTRRKSGEMARATALPYSSAYGPSRHSPDPG